MPFLDMYWLRGRGKEGRKEKGEGRREKGEKSVQICVIRGDFFHHRLHKLTQIIGFYWTITFLVTLPLSVERRTR